MHSSVSGFALALSGCDSIVSTDTLLPLAQLPAHRRHLPGGGRRGGEILNLVRIARQVEQLFIAEFGPEHILPVAADDASRRGNAIFPEYGRVLIEELVAPRGSGPRQVQPAQILALREPARRQTGGRENRG